MRRNVVLKAAVVAAAIGFLASDGALAQESAMAKLRAARGQKLCDALKRYPKPDGEKLGFEMGEVSALCKPFTGAERKDLDRCGDVKRDPYTSYFTWASRNEMSRRGKANLHVDQDMQPQLEWLNRRISELRESATQLCCANDVQCRAGLAKVEVSICKPGTDPDKPDPCVFGGSYKMPGRGYASVFRAIRGLHQDDSADAKELRRIADRNLTPVELASDTSVPGTNGGNIVLTSYVSKKEGVASMEPVILHEFGHACSMIRMQNSALVPGGDKALRAAQWLDSARRRCQPDAELPQAYNDLWESVGESKGLAQCLSHLTTLNRKQQIDRGCPGLCAGHYIEESVGIAFSLLLGNVGETAASVFPNTCDHVRDGQHPMVNDIVECLAQHSPRFREKLKTAFACK